MHIVEILEHHVIALDLLRMAAFLPKLMGLVGLVAELELAQLLQQRLEPASLERIDNMPCGKRLETTYLCGQITAARDPMQMVLHDDIAEDFHAALALQEAPRVEYDLHASRIREDRQPSDDGARHEVRVFGFEDAVTASAHGALPDGRQSLPGSAFPGRAWERLYVNFLICVHLCASVANR